MDNHAHDIYPPDVDTAEGAGMDNRRGRRMTSDEMIVETCERVRRLETRVTSALVALGYDTKAQKPRFSWVDGEASVHLPSRHCSLKEIIDSIPKNCNDPIGVYIGSDKVAVLGDLGNR